MIDRLLQHFKELNHVSVTKIMSVTTTSLAFDKFCTGQRSTQYGGFPQKNISVILELSPLLVYCGLLLVATYIQKIQ